MKYLIVPFILLLLPVVAVTAHGELSPPKHFNDQDDYYYEYNINSNNQHKVMKVYYEKNEFGNTMRHQFDVPSWTANIENWMQSGLITYGEHQVAFDWIIKNKIE